MIVTGWRYVIVTRNPGKWKRPHYNMDRLVDSPEGTATKHPPDAERRTIEGIKYPRVFRGPIGAGNIVQADPLRRDALRDRYGVMAIEMESSGVADAGWVAGVGYLVVRGTCDYCNSTKADAWHGYAALIAACYAKTVIEHVHPAEPKPEIATAQHSPDDANTLENEAARARRDSSSRTSPGWSGMTKSGGDRSVAIERGDVVGSTVITGNSNTVIFRAPSIPFGSSESTQNEETSPSAANMQPFAPIEIGLGSEALLSREYGMSAIPELWRFAMKDALGDLITKIDELIKESRWSDTIPLAEDLEKRLKALPRKGSVIRQGWTVLTRLEDHRQREAKLQGRAMDLSRLRALRKEAEDVID